MTLNKSLFNFGIFKNTIYRFKWGSLLYFVALFFSAPFMLLVADFDRLVERVIGSSFYQPTSMILRSDYLTIPLILAVLVPTVVAVLVFNNVHSSKQGIFTHGLPCDRRTNYISNLAAAFVLMAVPVFVNGTILMIMSAGKYGQVISSMSVVYWTALNLNMLFVMFAVAAFSAFLTGNIAAHIGINVLLHLVPAIIALAIMTISSELLYGFSEADSFIANELMANNPIVWLFGRSLSLTEPVEYAMPLFAKLQTWIYIIGAIVVYVLAYILYKNRKIEACGDVAAFKCFKPMLKYAVVASSTIVIFTILVSERMKVLPMFGMVLVLTAIVYFAAEMLMNKTFKVFKAFYKGFCGFVVCCGAFIAFFAYTNVFGYETRVPKPEDIKGAAIHAGWGNFETFEDLQVIDSTLKLHSEAISDIPTWNWDADGNRSIFVAYKLKDGGELRRRYEVTEKMFDKTMAEMYRSKEYKLSIKEIDNLNIENVNRVDIAAYCSGYHRDIILNHDAPQFLAAIKKDIEELSYKELEQTNNSLTMEVNLGCTVIENQKLKFFKDTGIDPQSPDANYARCSFRIALNSNFKNTYAFLKEQGYYEDIISEFEKSIVICKKPISRQGDIYTYNGESKRSYESVIQLSDCVDIEPEDERRLAETLATNARYEIPEGESYLVMLVGQGYGGVRIDIDRPMSGSKHANDFAWAIKAEYLPDYLKKYVEQ